MAQTPQSEEPGGAGDTTAPGPGRPQGLFGSSTTILLLVFAVAVFWWSRRRRVAMEERLRAQRLEAEATAERSALDVAHLMRAPQPGAAAAAAEEGLASATRMPTVRTPEPPDGSQVESRTAIDEEEFRRKPAWDAGSEEEARVIAIERAEAQAAAELAAEEQAERAARDAKRAGESAVRRMTAATAAADEAEVDTVEAERTAPIASVPAGAVAGGGTANCPPDYPIKGNRQSRIYHRPGQGSYQATAAEYCFSSAEAAEAAGFRPSRSRGQRAQPSQP